MSEKKEIVILLSNLEQSVMVRPPIVRMGLFSVVLEDTLHLNLEHDRVKYLPDTVTDDRLSHIIQLVGKEGEKSAF